MALYNTIGTGYNTTRRADPYLASRLYHFLQPQPDKLYLDIGCGTGNYTTVLAEKGVHFYAVDPSETMLQAAHSRNQEVNWLLGTAEQLPAADGQFAGAMATLTIHHWTDLAKGFKEIHRVLMDDGRFVLFTSLPEQTSRYWLAHYFPTLIEASAKQLPAMEVIESAAAEAGFSITQTEKYFVQPDLQDLFLYSGKFQPERYFDENIRNGISPFHILPNIQPEVETGLAQLRADIENGTFASVQRQYDNDLGDYLFLVMEKR